MERLLARLDRKITWTLIPPSPASVHAEMLHRVEQARNATAALAPEPHEPDPRFAAGGAWHLVATDAAGDVAGAVRLNVIDRRAVPLSAEDMLRFSHVEFPSDDARQQHLQVLQHLLDQAAAEPVIVYAGRLFAAPAWRGSGLAAVLGVAAIAMARLHASRYSASFTVVRGRAPELYRRLGGEPAVLPDGRLLGPFECGRHRLPLQLMLFDAMRPGLRAEPDVKLVADRLETLMGATTAPLGLRS